MLDSNQQVASKKLFATASGDNQPTDVPGDVVPGQIKTGSMCSGLDIAEFSFADLGKETDHRFPYMLHNA